MAKKRKPSKKGKGMSRAERQAYNKWLWNLQAEDFNKMSQAELAKIAGQYQRQFQTRAKALDKLQAETGIVSNALRVARNSFENTKFLTGPQFLPSSHIIRKGKIRYSVPQLRSIVSNYASFFREAKPGQNTIRTNTVEGTIADYERTKARLEAANKKVSDALGVPPEEMTPADFQAMWKAYDLFKEIYVEAFGILQSYLVQEAMVHSYQTAPRGTSTIDLVERMFNYAMDRAPTNSDLRSDLQDTAMPDNYYWGDELEKHLKSKGINLINWNNQV